MKKSFPKRASVWTAACRYWDHFLAFVEIPAAFAKKKRRGRASLQLEPLEDRCVPTTFAFTQSDYAASEGWSFAALQVQRQGSLLSSASVVPLPVMPVTFA